MAVSHGIARSFFAPTPLVDGWFFWLENHKRLGNFDFYCMMPSRGIADLFTRAILDSLLSKRKK